MRTRLALLTGSVVGIVLAGPTNLASPDFFQVLDCATQPDGTPCDDGDLCTYGDACGGGECRGWPMTCRSDTCATRACNGTSTCTVLSAALDGTSCDDGNGCTMEDACRAGGCAGMLVDNDVRVDRLAAGSATSVISWTLPSGATGSDVVRGHVSCLPVSPTGVCETPLVQNLIGTTSVQDNGVPASGDAYWYLVRGRNACGAGPWGFEAAHGLASIPEASNGGCVPNPDASPRYVDNGSTVTDQSTCLEWEKKTNSAPVNNVNNRYNWSQSGIAPDGTAFTVFLATLNAGRFARHTGWRLPSTGGCCGAETGEPAELESIIQCCPQPAIDPIFGQTIPSDYWSSSTVAGTLYRQAWTVDFGATFPPLYWGLDYKTSDWYVRAVRGGP